ncbi:Dyp-type peroxidase [Jatrophihabitans sp. YIM 134969]
MPHGLPTVTRRSALAGAAALGAGVVGGAVGWGLAPHREAEAGARAGDSKTVTGDRPSGDGGSDPVTGRRPFLRLAALDVVTTDPAALAALLERWTTVSVGVDATAQLGFGESVFDERFGLAARKPPALTTLPDTGLDRSTSHGDLLLRVTADSEGAASESLDTFLGASQGAARPRWLRSGHVGPRDAQSRVRNPLGFVDGTGNPVVGSPEFHRTVTVVDTAPEWLRGGSFLCFRRIRVDVARWSAMTTADQQIVIGRREDDGAPLSGGSPTSDVDLTAVDANGQLLIPEDSHVRLTAPAANSGATMFRNSYDYDDGLTAAGSRDTGLLFMAWVADPRSQFAPVLQRMLRSDRLNEFTTHTSTGVWAFPAAGGRFGAGLL